MKPTLAFIYVGRHAGQVCEFDWEWKLSENIQCTQEYRGKWYSLIKRDDGWYIIGHEGCAWDFATGWFDWDWLKEASLGHDILHWLIKRGVLSETNNDAIDNELMLIARHRGKAFGLKPRSWLIRKGTNLLDQKADGTERTIHYLYGEENA